MTHNTQLQYINIIIINYHFNDFVNKKKPTHCNQIKIDRR